MLDWFFETIFRRRMARAIARYRGYTLEPVVVRAVNVEQGSCLTTCLMLPLTALLELLKSLFRKLLYFLSIKKAADSLSYYWQRAFLLDHALALGHLNDEVSAHRARKAMERAMAGTASPLTQLAWEVARGTRHVLSALRLARRGETDVAIEEARSMMAGQWNHFADEFRALASRYERAYQEEPMPA